MIWIDLENTPHVVFFKPIIDELQKRGYKFIITARDCFQVCELADQMDIDYIKVGRHYGKNKILKSLGLLVRVMQLVIKLRRFNIQLALSHASRSQILYAKLFQIKQIVIIDYEYVKMLPFVQIDEMIIPNVIDVSAFKKYSKTVKKYPGIKENVYIPTFKPDPSIKQELNINNGDIVATVRPPATEAHYYNPASEELFRALINHLAKNKNVKMIILPRNRKQQNSIAEQWPQLIKNEQIVIPQTAVNGLNLLWYSDLVIGGGGTMNREAAALNIPVYSTFKGQIGAVDQYLEKSGLLTILNDPQELPNKIKLEKRSISNSEIENNTKTLDYILDRIIFNYKPKENHRN